MSAIFPASVPAARAAVRPQSLASERNDPRGRARPCASCSSARNRSTSSRRRRGRSSPTAWCASEFISRSRTASGSSPSSRVRKCEHWQARAASGHAAATPTRRASSRRRARGKAPQSPAPSSRQVNFPEFVRRPHRWRVPLDRAELDRADGGLRQAGRRRVEEPEPVPRRQHHRRTRAATTWSSSSPTCSSSAWIPASSAVSATNSPRVRGSRSGETSTSRRRLGASTARCRSTSRSTRLDDELVEAVLVPAARTQLATSRQQLLATMVMMGINRIVVTDGKISAKVMYDFQARDNMQFRKQRAEVRLRQTSTATIAATGDVRRSSYGGRRPRHAATAKDAAATRAPAATAAITRRATTSTTAQPVIKHGERLADVGRRQPADQGQPRRAGGGELQERLPAARQDGQPGDRSRRSR